MTIKMGFIPRNSTGQERIVSIHRLAIAGFALIFGAMGVISIPGQLFAEEAGKTWVSKVVSIQGRVTAKRLGQTTWQPVKLNDTLYAGERIRVEANSRAGIRLSNDAVLRLDQNTTLVFTEIEKEATFIFKLIKGAANFFSRRPRSLKILTPFVNGVVEGTEFYVGVDEDQTRIDLFEGRIRVENPYGQLQLAKGQSALAAPGSSPRRRILVKPRKSVQWALYYPPVLALGPGDIPVEIQDALTSFDQGRPLEAVDILGRTADDARGTTFHAVRAALLLHFGRVSQAREELKQAAAMDPGHAETLALQAIIAVVQNRKEEALQTARTAVRQKPASAAAQLAFSYALQAAFKLPEALKAAETAVAHAPENATAWARLAELRLSIGELDSGVRAARKATQLNPAVAHAHTILGFAYLTRIKTNKARKAFEQAIALDSVAPMPRLGLGLVKIRKGDLEAGRGEIEVAAALDPGNGLVRSYLGKAYFDEKRGPLDGKQLEIAKSLDPNDPTPWYYDAIRKQTINRPVEALQDFQKSIELNDNRAVFRSRLMLDEDLAARSSSLGMVFNDLDFQQIALNEGYKSLNVDSTNYSAHRLLADHYAAKPRHEIARVSELLQAQLFQPLNQAPVQAQLGESETVFFDGAGPGSISFGEFNPMFTRNRITLRTSAVGGGNKTWGSEISGSGVLGPVSLNVGDFHYQTDGFRENNDELMDITNLYLQGRLSAKTSLQAEYRYSRSKSGDLSQNFDGLISTDQRDKEDVIKARIGAHHKLSSQIELVASYIRSDVSFERNQLFFDAPNIITRDTKGDQYEVRTDIKKNRFGLTAGFSYIDGTLYEDSILTPLPGLVVTLDEFEVEFIKETAYAYSYFNLFDHGDLILGLSSSSLKQGVQISEQQLNPKFGLALGPFANTTFRLSAFRILSSTFVSTQSVEPTQVAGFNQFYDDLDASDVQSYGGAIDHKFSNRLFGGMEYLHRNLEVPLFRGSGPDNAVFFDWKEDRGLAYIYWTPCDVAALSLEYQYEQLDRRDNPLTFGAVDIETHRVPLRAAYFAPSGFSFKLVATYYLQDGEFAATNNVDERFSGNDNFWILDTEVSYRLPKRRGALSVGIKNLLDQEFNYQDTDPSNPAAVPGFLGFAKISLSF
jgi:tetratricopeptide (TPR) repeat protein